MAKICRICNVEKDLTFFYKREHSKDGYRSECKFCKNNLQKENIKNKVIDYISVDTKKCYKCKTEKNINEFSKNKYIIDGHDIKCKSCCSIYKKGYNIFGKYKIKEYRKNNANRIKETTKEYKDNYKDNYKDKRNKIRNDKKKTDPLYRFTDNIRSLTRCAFQRNGYKKNSRTEQILGLSFEEAKVYFENLFESWMTWNNHGNYTGNYNETWQIDHIEPISNGNSTEEIIRLSHYTNLRPLCSRRNLEKGNKLIMY